MPTWPDSTAVPFVGVIVWLCTLFRNWILSGSWSFSVFLTPCDSQCTHGALHGRRDDHDPYYIIYMVQSPRCPSTTICPSTSRVFTRTSPTSTRLYGIFFHRTTWTSFWPTFWTTSPLDHCPIDVNTNTSTFDIFLHDTISYHTTDYAFTTWTTSTSDFTAATFFGLLDSNTSNPDIPYTDIHSHCPTLRTVPSTFSTRTTSSGCSTYTPVHFTSSPSETSWVAVCRIFCKLGSNMVSLFRKMTLLRQGVCLEHLYRWKTSCLFQCLRMLLFAGGCRECHSSAANEDGYDILWYRSGTLDRLTCFVTIYWNGKGL